jgi:hypothetical protein
MKNSNDTIGNRTRDLPAFSEVKRQEVTGAQRKLRTDKLHDLYSLLNMSMAMKSRMIRFVEHVVHMAEKKNAYMVLVGKPVGRRLLRLDIRLVVVGGQLRASAALSMEKVLPVLTA